MEWQPIETAPEDGTFYIAYSEDHIWVENMPEGHYAGEWHWSNKRGCWRGHAHMDDRDATHWMPLPAPPESKND